MPATLRGKRVLVVEDEPLIAYDIAGLLDDFAIDVVGPAFTMNEGRQLAGDEAIDAALLDIDLGNERVWPLADMLAQRGTPLGFVSAQCRQGDLPERFRDRPCVMKPAMHDAILSALVAMKL